MPRLLLIALLYCYFKSIICFQWMGSKVTLISNSYEDVLSASMSKSDQSSIRAETVVTYPNLKVNMFAHPADIQLMEQLSSIPLIESFARRLYSTVEQVMVVENLGSSVVVGPNQMPALHKLLTKSSKILDIEPPDLYVKQNPTPNAYTLAVQGKKPFIVMHTGLLDIMNEEEVLAVLGHELGHLKCEHGIWLTLLSILFESIDMSLGRLIPIRGTLLRWQRSAEFTSDRASLLVTDDYRPVVSVLMKLCGGSSKNEYSKDMNVEAFLQQVDQLNIEGSTIPGNAYMLANERVATHPIPVLRAHELVKWYNSPQFSGLRKRSRMASL